MGEHNVCPKSKPPAVRVVVIRSCLGGTIGADHMRTLSDRPGRPFCSASREGTESVTAGTGCEVGFVDCVRLVENLRDVQACGIPKKRLRR